MIRRVFALLLVALAGCSSSATIDPLDYDQSCTVDTDCRSIIVGDTCDCGCNSAAINVADYPRYLEDYGTPSCGTTCGLCPAVTVTCPAGRCRAQ
jgi:hypothetical protein